MAKGSRKGYTVVEILVAIAVISILAAFVFPVLGRARERAKAAPCQSNLRQLGAALHQYVQDWDDSLPHSYMLAGGGYKREALRSWMDGLFPYLNAKEVFLCPTNPAGWNAEEYWVTKKLNGTGVPGKGTVEGMGRFPVSYGVNTYLFRGSFAAGLVLSGELPESEIRRLEEVLKKRGYTPPASVHLADIPRPDATLAVGETRYGGVLDEFPYLFFWRKDPSDGPELPFLHHHARRMNFLFMDGHVKDLKFIQTFLPHPLWGSNELILSSFGRKPSQRMTRQDLPLDPMTPNHRLIRTIPEEYR